MYLQLSPINAKIMKAMNHVHEMEAKVGQFAVLDYRAVVLPFVKSLLKVCGFPLSLFSYFDNLSDAGDCCHLVSCTFSILGKSIKQRWHPLCQLQPGTNGLLGKSLHTQILALWSRV